MGIMSSTMIVTALAASGQAPPAITAIPIEGERVCQEEMLAYAKQFPDVKDLNSGSDKVSFTLKLPYGGPTTYFYLRCQPRR